VTTSAAGAQPAHATVAAASVAAPAPPSAARTPAAAPIGTVTLVAAGREHTHTVQRGDTLSEIAEQWLGDAHRWPEIFALHGDTARAVRQGPYGVSLPGGSWVDLGLAGAIAAAVALVWAHRRRRYTRRPPSATLRTADPALAAMPPVVTQVRRGLRHAADDI